MWKDRVHVCSGVGKMVSRYGVKCEAVGGEVRGFLRWTTCWTILVPHSYSQYYLYTTSATTNAVGVTSFNAPPKLMPNPRLVLL